MGQLHDLLLAHNDIKSITKDDFIGLNKLQVLNMEGNKIEYIDPEAFVNFQQLEDLNLGNNMFAKLPSQGLQKLLHLKTFNNAKLKELPDPEHFPRIQSLILSYAYHCCAFLPIVAEVSVAKTNLQDSIIFPMPDMELDMNLWNSSQTDLWPQLQNLSNKFGSEITELWENFGSDFTYPVNLPTYVDEYFQEENMKTGSASAIPPGNIQCLPVPGPFLPCEDLFDWWSLRCGVWVVFLLSILGNGTVVFVLMFSRSKMDVPRFLVCNLAAADFFMGIYLGLLAVVDASTLGKFRMFAIPWQMSLGCQLAGFLAVLSSELSVYTLAVITLERNYAITHAMHLNKRLSLKHAGYIMTVGWMFALAMALLPLFGVSDYRKFAICLPFETTDRASLTYVVFLMFINGLAFLILMGCYLKMYCAIKGSHAWNSNDSRIAKRMALLVFTDFLCWSPIAFFSLTAVFGLQLISLEEAKVFAVFILPLNSCCNPFLYAILTKQFKKDCVLICKTIEESRVTRGIGRCRHSSNFSNRHTPANTNSLVERSSRDAPPLNAHTCGCAVKLLCDSAPQERKPQPLGLIDKARRYLCSARNSDTGSNRYAYQIAEIQQKQHKRTGSLSSDNFSSSRSNSWRRSRLKIYGGALVCEDSHLEGKITIGVGCVLHPKACIIASAGPVVLGDNCIVEEYASIIYKSTDGKPAPPLIIGSNNVFEVGCTVYSHEIGENNIFEIKCVVGSGIRIKNKCVIGPGCVLDGKRTLEDNTVIYGNCNQREAIYKQPSQNLQLDFLRKVLPNYHHLKKANVDVKRK
ncbi:lutropin-choriogonadotropic hormone receptor-like [Ctenocephalides felis]|uniref:lutropin-choriogonadotropic hormone receptor-like n=1 Tax=Ctenocephalides felis TaxID=7515 RepID=UPI000E6E495F|nr:lutropin-choriogonadotropic hormone receptor-like [Ctenocephalides felis]